MGCLVWLALGSGDESQLPGTDAEFVTLNGYGDERTGTTHRSSFDNELQEDSAIQLSRPINIKDDSAVWRQFLGHLDQYTNAADIYGLALSFDS